MFFNSNLNDSSPEAKADRRKVSMALKISIILGLFALLLQQVLYIIILWDKLFTSWVSLFIFGLIFLWSWCIYKMWKIDLTREDKEDKST